MLENYEAPVVPVIQIPVMRTPLHELTMRPPQTKIMERRQRRSYSMHSNDQYFLTGTPPRDMVAIMERWDTFVNDTRSLCSEKFWSIFLSMHQLSGVAIDTALTVVKKTFMQDELPHMKKRFPTSRTKLLKSVQTLQSFFWPHVMHTTRIDLSNLESPRKLGYVDFKFVDPVFGWLVAARRQRPDEMHWRPIPAKNTNGDQVFGGGIHQGLAFREACRSCENAAYPMAISLHWDGTGATGVQATPICVGVANSNNSGPDTQFCLGFIPVVPGMGKEFWRSPHGTTAKFHIRQQVVGAILRVLEQSAERGVLCPLQSLSGAEVILLLKPRLMCMNIDQPEAQLYFGMRNRHSCSKCIRRTGYSCFRQCTAQSGDIIRRLYDVFQHEGTPAVTKKKAYDKLRRYGFNPERRCLLTSFADKLLVRVPQLTPRVEVFPCCDFRDILHGLGIFLYRIVCGKGINLIAWSSNAKQLLDMRLADVCAQRHFRDQDDRSYRVQKSIFSEADMSAKDKVQMMFFLPHVLGHTGSVVPVSARIHLLTAIARVQLMLIACRGRRQYSVPEFRQIYDEGYVTVFRCMELIHEAYHDRDFARKSDKHEKNPDSNPRPKRYCSKHRYFVHLTDVMYYILRTLCVSYYGRYVLHLTDVMCFILRTLCFTSYERYVLHLTDSILAHFTDFMHVHLTDVLFVVLNAGDIDPWVRRTRTPPVRTKSFKLGGSGITHMEFST